MDNFYRISELHSSEVEFGEESAKVCWEARGVNYGMPKRAWCLKGIRPTERNETDITSIQTGH